MKKFLVILLALLSLQLPAQDLPHFKRIVKQLSSARYQGRGYARDGADKAGLYLQKEFWKAGADEVTLQPFTLDVTPFCVPVQGLSSCRFRDRVFRHWRELCYDPVHKCLLNFE